MSSKKNVLITGAAGKVGRILRDGLASQYRLRLLDIEAINDSCEVVAGDINDPSLLDRAMESVDAVVHLAADARVQANFGDILHNNISGTYQIYEAARRNRVKRVVFASSSHVVGNHSPLRSAAKEEDLYSVSLPLTAEIPVRPDSLYGVSKVFGEALARYYADSLGVTSICLRLGSATPDPAFLATPRAWAFWISNRDLCELFRCAIDAEDVTFAVIYGCSANTRRWVDLNHARELIGYVPQDDSEALLPVWYRDGIIAPAPKYRLPWGERLAALPVSAGRMNVVWIGQSGFFVKFPDETVVAIDPFLTEWPDRIEPPLLPASDLPADLILISHTHRDHLDVHALPVIAETRPHARFIAPPTGCEKLAQLGLNTERMIQLRPGESHQFGSATVIAIPSRHEITAPDAQGYVIQTPQGTLYHTGDTEYDPCLMDAHAYHPDLLMVPINGRKGNMSAEQAAQLSADLSPRVVIPMHYGCLQPRADLPARFLSELQRVAPSVRPAMMELGAILQFPLAPQ